MKLFGKNQKPSKAGWSDRAVNAQREKDRKKEKKREKTQKNQGPGTSGPTRRY